jgi:hypothetical protein
VQQIGREYFDVGHASRETGGCFFMVSQWVICLVFNLFLWCLTIFLMVFTGVFNPFWGRVVFVFHTGSKPTTRRIEISMNINKSQPFRCGFHHVKYLVGGLEHVLIYSIYWE